jgi:hypothetical protein
MIRRCLSNFLARERQKRLEALAYEFEELNRLETLARRSKQAVKPIHKRKAQIKVEMLRSGY